MENLFTQKSFDAPWSSPSSTTWAMDLVLAFVCGLGLFLLLVPFLQGSPPSPLSSPQPLNKKNTMRMLSSWHRSRKKYSPWKARGDSPRKLKQKAKDGSPLEKSPGYQLSSLGSMFKSTSTEQDANPLHDMKTKTEQLMDTQKLSDPKTLGSSFQQKYSQLFWGLPSLHSESLLATAWIPQSSSVLQSPFWLFNGISNVCPVLGQDKMSPLLSQTYLESRSSSLILSLPQIQSPPLEQVQTHLLSSPQVLLPSSLPLIADSETFSTQSQNKPKLFISTEMPSSEKPSLRKQLESVSSSSSVVQRPQAYNVFTPNPSQDWVVPPIFPENFPISSEVREKLEQHIQTWRVQHWWDLLHKIQGSLELMQLQDEFPRICKANYKPGPSRSAVSTCDCSRNVQNVRSQLRKDSSKNLGQILGLPRGLERSPVKGQGANMAEPERNPVKCLKRDSRNDSLRNIDRNVENIPKIHLGTKSGQINQGLPPLSVHRSCPVSKDFSMSDTNMETRHLASLKRSENAMKGSQNLVFLSPYIRHALQAHVIKFWVRHQWGLPLKVLKPIKVLNSKKAQPSNLPLWASPSTTCCVSGANSTAEVVNFLGKPSQTCFRKVIIDESSSSLGSLVTSPSGQETERSLMRNPSVDDCDSPKAPPTRQESRHPSATLTHNHMGRTHHSKAVLESGKEKQEVSYLLGRSVAQCFSAPCCQAETANQLETLVEMELADQPQHYATDQLFPHCSRNLLLPADDLAAQGLGEPVVLGRDRVKKQKPSVPKNLDSWKNQDKAIIPMYQGGDNKRQNVANHETTSKDLKTSKFTQVKGPENTFDSKYQKPLPKHKEFPLESPFQNVMRHFLRQILPKIALKVQGEPPAKGEPPPSTTAQSQRQVKKPRVDHSVREAQQLMATVGEMLEKKMSLYRNLQAPKANQNQEDPHTPTSQAHYHRPPSYSEQKRITSAIGTPSFQRYPEEERHRHVHVRGQCSLKSMRFNHELQVPQHLCLMPTSKAFLLVSPSQHQTPVPGASSSHQHCPRHYVL